MNVMQTWICTIWLVELVYISMIFLYLSASLRYEEKLVQYLVFVMFNFQLSYILMLVFMLFCFFFFNAYIELLHSKMGTMKT